MRTLTKITSFVLSVIIVSFVLTSCHSTRDNFKADKSIINQVENFDEFYNRFHSDSIFLISRLKFPLKGGPDRGDGQDEWTKDNWLLLKTKIYDVDTTQYKVSYEKHEKSFIEKVWLENSGFSFKYSYELIDKKWFLVSAFELNN